MNDDDGSLHEAMKNLHDLIAVMAAAVVVVNEQIRIYEAQLTEAVSEVPDTDAQRCPTRRR